MMSADPSNYGTVWQITGSDPLQARNAPGIVDQNLARNPPERCQNNNLQPTGSSVKQHYGCFTGRAHPCRCFCLFYLIRLLLRLEFGGAAPELHKAK